MRTLCRDLARSIPRATRINRGKLNLGGVAEQALESNADRVVILDRWKGGPGKVELFRVGSWGLTPVPPIFYIAGVRLRREFEAVTRPPHDLVVTTPPECPPETEKIAESLASFLQIPVSTVEEAASKYSTSMHVSSGPSSLTRITFLLLPEAVEVGPSLTLSHTAWETRG